MCIHIQCWRARILMCFVMIRYTGGKPKLETENIGLMTQDVSVSCAVSFVLYKNRNVGRIFLNCAVSACAFPPHHAEFGRHLT